MADKYGPDWWPDFGWRKACIWLAQGFATPIVFFLSVWLVATLVIWMVEGLSDFAGAYNLGGFIAMWGFFASFGGVAITTFLSEGAQWKTAFRVIGAVIAIVLMWHVVLGMLSD